MFDFTFFKRFKGEVVIVFSSRFFQTFTAVKRIVKFTVVWFDGIDIRYDGQLMLLFEKEKLQRRMEGE